MKIQRQGQRRTIRLRASRKKEAAREAARLHAKITRLGWEAISASNEVAGERKTETSKVKPRLVLRNYCCVGTDGGFKEYSAQLEHGGQRAYFPLGSMNVEAAMKQAERIRTDLLGKGWSRTSQTYAREVTVAFHWAQDPLGWTYSTFHTAPGPPGRASSKEEPRLLLLECDASLAAALARRLERETGWRIQIVAAFEKVREHLDPSISLLVVNHTASLGGPLNWLQTFRGEYPRCPVLLFSAYEDSDQLFSSTPGGASGYILRRTPAERLLEPIEGLFRQPQFGADQIASRVRHYFQNIVGSLGPAARSQEMAKLTVREDEILKLLSRGYLDKEIAQALKISSWTVHGHLKRIFEKLNVHTRTEAAIKYLQK